MGYLVYLMNLVFELKCFLLLITNLIYWGFCKDNVQISVIPVK